MSEDELAWEKRFVKVESEEILHEKQVIQNDKFAQKTFRTNNKTIDEIENYFTFDKIALNEEEVQKVRTHRYSVSFPIFMSSESLAFLWCTM